MTGSIKSSTIWGGLTTQEIVEDLQSHQDFFEEVDKILSLAPAARDPFFW